MARLSCLACQFQGKCLTGSGNDQQPALLVVGDHPAGDDLRHEVAFSGVAGRTLKQAIANILGLDPAKDVYYTYAIRGDRRNESITNVEIQACRTWLWQEIQRVRPKVILAAGNIARQAVFSDAGPGFRDARGQLLHDPMFGWPIFVTYSILEVEKFSAKESDGRRRFTFGSVPWFFWQDLKRLHTILNAL